MTYQPKWSAMLDGKNMLINLLLHRCGPLQLFKVSSWKQQLLSFDDIFVFFCDYFEFTIQNGGGQQILVHVVTSVCKSQAIPCSKIKYG